MGMSRTVRPQRDLNDADSYMNYLGTPAKPRRRFFCRRAATARRGVAAVEFALVFPLIALFTLSLFFCVRTFVTRNAAENAAYCGARTGIIADSTIQEIEQAIREEMQLGFVSKYRYEIERNSASVKVRVIVPMDGSEWFTRKFAPNGITVVSECELRSQMD